MLPVSDVRGGFSVASSASHSAPGQAAAGGPASAATGIAAAPAAQGAASGAATAAGAEIASPQGGITAGVGAFAALYAGTGPPGQAPALPAGVQHFGPGGFGPIVMTPNRVANAVANNSKLVGMQLGKIPGTSQVVTVKREIGSTAGYDDRLKAIAVARMGKADPAAVILGKDGKWHAVEVSTAFHNKKLEGDNPAQKLHGLPSNADLTADRKTVADLEAKLGRQKKVADESKGDKFTDGTEVVKVMEGAIEKTEKELAKARETLDAHILGVDPSEVNFTATISGIQEGKINIIGMPDAKSPGGGHGPVPGQGGVDFKPDMKTAMWIDRDQLANPARAANILFHEQEHWNDYAFAKTWVNNYLNETKRQWFGRPGMPLFEKWLTDQTKTNPQRLTEAQARLVSDEALDATATTEARANLHAVLATLQSGDVPQAMKDLEGYAKALLPKSKGGQYATPAQPDSNPITVALVKEIKAAYKQLPPDLRKQFDAGMAAAKAANPSAWFVGIDLKK